MWNLFIGLFVGVLGMVITYSVCMETIKHLRGVIEDHKSLIAKLNQQARISMRNRD